RCLGPGAADPSGSRHRRRGVLRQCAPCPRLRRVARPAYPGQHRASRLGSHQPGCGCAAWIFPLSCSGSRTTIGDSMNAKTQMYSITALTAVVVVLIGARGVLSAFPTAALGAMVVYAAIRLVDVPEFRRIGRFRRSELLLALATLIAVLVLGVLYGVLIAIGLSIFDLLRRVARAHDAILGFVPGVPGMHDIDDYPQAEPVPGLLIYRYDAPLCFANAEDFRRRALEAIDQ